MKKIALSELLTGSEVKNRLKEKRFLIGFDGFTDEIVACVEKRISTDEFEPFKKIADFGKKIVSASGKSKNFELVVKTKKIGGNGPILALALIEAGAEIDLIGALGLPDIEPIFLPLTNRCKSVYSIAPSGHTDAVEFHDGKLILGKHASIISLDITLIEKYVGKKRLIELFDRTDFFISANWTMILQMTEIWRYITDTIAPNISKKERLAFFDLADPAKRDPQELKSALDTLSHMQKTFQVHLGLNVSECEQVASVLGIEHQDDAIEETIKKIRLHLSLSAVCVHGLDFAAAATENESIKVKGPYCSEPKLSTGGGDNFNAGYCLGQSLDLDLESALLLGVATSGFYVRNAHSPSLDELANFLKKWQ